MNGSSKTAGFAVVLAALVVAAACSNGGGETDGAAGSSSGDHPVVVMTTNRGTIEIELYPDKAPATVENFLVYVDSGFYDGTIFHRVIKDFMIQGGGYSSSLVVSDAPA